MKRIIAIADDLSGAAETAAALTRLSAQMPQPGVDESFDAAHIVLVPEDPEVAGFEHPGHSCVVFDSDSRRVDAHEASVRLETLLRRIYESRGRDPLVFLKVDSLLRGHMSAEIGVLLKRGPVIFAPALPVLGRSTVGGVVHSAGIPLNESSLWSAERKAAPATIADALAPLASGLVGLDTVRGDRRELDRVLSELADQHAIAVCDAETTEDLDIIAAAGLRRKGVQLVGASAFAAAIFRAVDSTRPPSVRKIGKDPGQQPDASPTIEAGSHRKSALIPVLLVVGTASTQSRTQLQTLASSGVGLFTVTQAELLTDTADSTALRKALLAGPVAVSISATETVNETSTLLTAALARFIAPIAERLPLVLTGGETARAVLNALYVHWLEPIAEIEHGAVLSRTDHGTLVVTRPGTFGGPESLHTILGYIHSHLATETASPHVPGKAHA